MCLHFLPSKCFGVVCFLSVLASLFFSVCLRRLSSQCVGVVFLLCMMASFVFSLCLLLFSSKCAGAFLLSMFLRLSLFFRLYLIQSDLVTRKMIVKIIMSELTYEQVYGVNVSTSDKS